MNKWTNLSLLLVCILPVQASLGQDSGETRPDPNCTLRRLSHSED